MTRSIGIIPSDPLSRPSIPRPDMRMRCRNASPSVASLLSKLMPAPHGCWVPRNKPQADGYVMVRVGGRAKRMAHIVAWEVLVGPVPDRHELDHLCRVRRCCNPEHLEPVTPSENTRRSANGVRLEVCSEGHAIEGENAFLTSRGHSRCKRCYFADNARRQKASVVCPGCGRYLTAGSLPRHRRENCPSQELAA